MSDEHVQGTDAEVETEQVATGGHQDRAEQWEKDDGAESTHGGAQQDTADQWVSEGGSTKDTQDAAHQWSGDHDAQGAQDTAAQWYEEGDRRE